MKLTEECLAKCCGKPTNQGYVLCYSSAVNKELIEDIKVHVYTYALMDVYL